MRVGPGADTGVVRKMMKPKTCLRHSDSVFLLVIYFPSLSPDPVQPQGVTVVLFLAGLPSKADGLHLPGFGVIVSILLWYVGPRHVIPHYSRATPNGRLPIRHPGEAPLHYDYNYD